jgi:lysozyme family protein
MNAMSYVFSALGGEYAVLLAATVIDPKREAELEARTKVILARAADENWQMVAAATGVPRLWGMASFERESGSDYTLSPAQGDPWRQVSTHVPRGLGPYKSWAAAAVAAYRIDHLDKVGAANWTWARACYEGELFNGFGYRTHGIHTPYLWSWTNIYTRGKFVTDGRFDAAEQDQQCGIIPLMVALSRLDPSLALADPWPGGRVGPPEKPPVGIGGGGHDTAWIQAKLNALGAQPALVVDNNYGRATRRAVSAFQAQHHLQPDGLAGPETIAAIEGLA